MLDSRDVIAGLEQAGLCPGVKPGHSAAQHSHVKFVFLEIKQIQIGDLEFAAARWFQRFAEIDNLFVVDVEAGHREVRFRLFWFLFQTDRATVRPEFDDAIALWIAHLISEDASAVLPRERFAKEVEFAVENVVTQDKARARIADKLFADKDGFGNSARLRLLGVIDSNAQLRSVAKVIA